MRRIFYAIPVFCCCAALIFVTACRTRPTPGPLSKFVFRHPAMGTGFSITLYAPDEQQAKDAAEAAFKRIDDLEDIFSDYQADSELSLLREHPVGTPIPVSRDLFAVLKRSREIYRASGGAFDVTAGPFTHLWRFSRKRGKLPSSEELNAARRAVGMDKLKLNSKAQTVTLTVPGMRLDVGGIAKGYAADQALELLKQRGLKSCLVAASGDIVVGDPPPGKPGWTVAVEGIDRAAANTKFLIRHAAVSTSGDTEQFVQIEGVRYSHILNPATGLGLTNRIQATVLAPKATLSDALATSVCVLGTSRGLELIRSTRGTAVIIVEKRGDNLSVVRSPRLIHFSPR